MLWEAGCPLVGRIRGRMILIGPQYRPDVDSEEVRVRQGRKSAKISINAIYVSPYITINAHNFIVSLNNQMFI